MNILFVYVHTYQWAWTEIFLCLFYPKWCIYLYNGTHTLQNPWYIPVVLNTQKTLIPQDNLTHWIRVYQLIFFVVFKRCYSPRKGYSWLSVRGFLFLIITWQNFNWRLPSVCKQCWIDFQIPSFLSCHIFQWLLLTLVTLKTISSTIIRLLFEINNNGMYILSVLFSCTYFHSFLIRWPIKAVMKVYALL